MYQHVASRAIGTLSLWGSLLALLTALPVAAGEQELGVFTVCIADGDVPPFTAVKTETPAQQLIRSAAALQGWQVKYVSRPWRRCVHEVHDGKLDAIAAVGASDENLQALVLPMRNSEADPVRAMGSVRIVVYRPLGGRASWDGQAFSGLTEPVLIVAGASVMRDLLGQMGIKTDETARSPESMAQMLLRRQHNLAIDLELRVQRLQAQPEFAGRFEVLPQPFAEIFGYLAVSPSVYSRHGPEIEQMWTDLGHLRRKQPQP